MAREGYEVVSTRHLEAAPERVFAAFIDPAVAPHWLFRTPGSELGAASFDPVTGGEFSIRERRGDETFTYAGEYLEIAAPHTLRFAFSVDNFRTFNEVRIAIAPEEEGSALTVTHLLDPQWAKFADRTRATWTALLDNLAALLAAANRI